MIIAINPTIQYPKTHSSNVPSFQHSNWGEAPNLSYWLNENVLFVQALANHQYNTFKKLWKVLLVYQGLRADSNARLVLERQQELEARSRAFSELASKTALWDPEDIESLEALTEIVSGTMAVRRASVWGYYEDEKILKCEDSFDRGTNGHTRGTVLKLDDYPQLFQDLIEGEDIIIADAAVDPRTSELHRVYLGPLGSTSLLTIPVMSGGDPLFSGRSQCCPAG